MRERRHYVIGKAAAAAAVAAVLAGMGGAGAFAGVADVTPDRDGTIYQPDPFFGLVSNGAGEALFAGMTGQNSVRRGLVHFDLSALPSNAVVNSASVSMYSTKAPLTNYVFLHRALASWGEGTSNGFTTGGQGDTPTTDDVTWQHRFYDTVNWATPGGDFAATASARSATPVLTGDFAFASNAALVADVQGWINNPIANFGWAVLGEETAAATAKRIASREYSDESKRPTLHVGYSTSTWKSGGGGAWSASGNWDFGVPNGAGVEANFSLVLANPSASIPINVDGAKTAGILNFTSGNHYVLSGSTLTLDRAGAGGARNQINVTHGNQLISSALQLNRSTDIDVAAGAALTASNLSTAGASVSLDKRGGGTFNANHLRLGALNVEQGTVAITPSGSAAGGTSTLNALALTGGGRLDLGDNKLITNAPIGTFTGGAYNGVQGEIARAYDFGSWDLPGLMTSMPDAGPLVGTTTLGISDGATILFLGPTETGTFGGQPVTGSSTIVMYTYAGDVNFDGLVDASDYGIIDNYFQFPGTTGYANGDFNYDGVIDAGDYGIIDNTFQLQGAPIPTGAGALAGITAVPEPTTAVLLLLTPLAGLARRRRR